MNLYLISAGTSGWDVYDSAVVAAESESEAKATHPGGGGWSDDYGTWVTSPEQVTVQWIGTALPSVKKGVIVASFIAG